jgi:phosphoribosylformylglycinamidine synthase subunit PurS
MAKYNITVTLKKDILNPEARALQRSLNNMGFCDLDKIKISKNYTMELSSNCQDPLNTIEQIASQYLSNPVSEKFTIDEIVDDNKK